MRLAAPSRYYGDSESCNRKSHQRAIQKIGGLVEDFTLPGVNGGQVSLADAIEGKKGIVTVFWSGVCSHCVRYDAYLNSFAERHPELGLAVIASRSGETAEQIRKTMAERNIQFPIGIDAGSVIARRWSTEQTPRAYLVDTERVLCSTAEPSTTSNIRATPNSSDISRRPSPNSSPASRCSAPRPSSFGCAIQSVYYTLPDTYE